MGIQVQLILSACIANFVLTSAQSRHQISNESSGTSKVNDESQVQENFQNLFNSIARNNAKKSDIYRGILKHEEASEQRAFNSMKEDLWIAQNRNAHKRRNFYGKSNTNEKVIATKRETNENRHNRVLSSHSETKSAATKETEFTKELYIFPEIHDGNALQPTFDLLLSQKCYHEEMVKIYRRMLRKNENAQYLPRLEATISSTRLIIDVDIEILREYLKTGTPDDAIKKQPWNGVASDGVLNGWRKMKEWSEKMRGEHIDAEIDAMVKVADLAIREMEVYQKYADMMYDEMVAMAENEEQTGSLV